MKQSVCLLTAWILTCSPAAAASLEQAWQQMLHLDAAGATDQFARDPGSGEARLGQALALLNLQTKTRSDIERANTLLQTVCQSDANDEFGITALYYMARVAQVYRYEPDYDLAIKLFDQLVASHPDHPLGQMAVVKLAILRIYDRPATDDKPALLRTVAASGEKLTDPVAIRDFHLVMADAYGHFQVSDEKSLQHLLAAYNAGGLSGKVASDVLVRIGELARILGHKDMAIEFYRKFLQEFPRDLRSFTIKQRLAELS